MMADESTVGTPPAESTSEHPSTDDVKSDSSASNAKAVPYHRFQKEVWKSQELNQKLHDLEREVESLRQTRSHEPEPESEEVPDRDIDPDAYYDWKINQAERTARQAQEKFESFRLEQEKQQQLSDLQDEFANAVGRYPGIDNDEDMREFAWQSFIINKEQTQGRASGDEIMAAFDSRLSSYHGGNKNKDKLRGKPKRKTPSYELDGHSYESGKNLEETGYRKEGFGRRLDAKMRAARERITERMNRQDKRTSGL